MTLAIELEPEYLQVLAARAAQMDMPIERAAAEALRHALQSDEEWDAMLDERDAKRLAQRAPVAVEECRTLDELRAAIGR